MLIVNCNEPQVGVQIFKLHIILIGAYVLVLCKGT